MTRENAKNIAEAISFKIKDRQRLILDGANELIDQIFNDHEVLLKEAYDKGYLSAVKDILNKKVTHGND